MLKNRMALKESYYTLENIDHKARRFLSEVASLKSKHRTNILSQKTALLVIDMQEYFYSSLSHAFIPSMPAIVPKIKKLQNFCLEKNFPVIQTKHTNNIENLNLMGNWWGNYIHDNSQEANIIADIYDQRAHIIPKSQYDSFWQTDLEKRLKKSEIDSVIITGVMTNLCCETTARAAFVRGFKVFFVIDGTATYNAQFHRASILNLAHGFAFPSLTEDIMAIGVTS